MMRERLQAKGARRQQAGRASARKIGVPLPLAGLYAKARTAQVQNLFAAELTNLRSNGVSLETRPAVSWSESASAAFRRIPFEVGSASRYITLTPTGATSGDHALTRAFSAAATFGTISGYVVIADGNGKPVTYNDDGFSISGFTATEGPTPALCDGIVCHHDRVYLWQTGGPLEFLVGDVGAITGPMTRFPLGRLGNITGSMLCAISLTVDAGHGMNDLLCVITTTGQMIIYEGLDPTDEQDWRLTARIKGAAPLGPRAFCQIGSDAWMLTSQGPVSIGQAVRESVLALVSDVARPIADDIASLVRAGPAEWQMFTADDGSMVVINRYADGAAQQFIYYLDSRAWGTADFPARDWHNLGGVPQITGTNGRLGSLVSDGTGDEMTARWVSSWFSIGSDVSVPWVEPVIRALGPMSVRMVVLSDNNDTVFDIAEAEQTITLEPDEADALGEITLSDIFGTEASGDRFQITLEVTARWAEIIGMSAGVQS